MSAFVIGTLVSILGLFGLILASNAIDTGMHHFGFALFGFSVFYVFWLIKAAFNPREQS
jgi:hypothetical protein